MQIENLLRPLEPPHSRVILETMKTKAKAKAKSRSPLDNLQSRKMKELSDSVARFFRIITPSVLKENKLVLPKLISEKYGDKLSKVIRLIVPAGGIWKVELEKFGDVLLLCDGWQKFMDHHSIPSGYFLFFKYRGNSEFDVNVFDLTATEIQYPSSGNSEMPRYIEEEEEVDDDDDDASIAILDSPFANTRLRSSNNDASTECLNQVSKRRTRELSPTNLGHQPSRSTDALELESSNELNQETCSKRHKSSSGNYSKGRAPTAQERKRVLNAAKLYKSVNPSFILPLKTYNVHKHYTVHVPAKFSRECMQHCPEVIELQDSDNKKWPTHCIIIDGKVSFLSKGWSEFVKKEELNAGDVCVFELVQTNDVVLKVTIFRTMKD